MRSVRDRISLNEVDRAADKTKQRDNRDEYDLDADGWPDCILTGFSAAFLTHDFGS